jgi:8-oxo-dGTP diphosphatase
VIYKNCPFCGTKYNFKNKDVCGKYPKQLNCFSCKNIFYNNPKPAVAGLIFRDGKILLTKRKRDPYKGYWDMPGGFMEYGENPNEALSRELKEELDINVSNFKIIDSFKLLYPATKNDNFTLCILVFEVIEDNLSTIKVGDDVDDYLFFDKKSFPENIAFKEQKRFLKDILKTYSIK